MIFSYGLIYGIGICAGWELSELYLLLFAVLQIGISYGRKFLQEKRIPVDACLTLLGIGILLVAVFNESGRTYLTECISYYGKWQFTGSLDMRYGWIPVYLLLALGAFLYQKASEYVKIKVLISALILVFLSWQAWMEWEWGLLPIAALLFSCLDGIIGGYRRYAAKQKEIRTKEVLPLLVLVILLVSALPVREEPVSWAGVIQLWEETKEKVNELLTQIAYGDGENEFGVGTVGFSQDDSSFWGRITDGRKREMLKISVYTGAKTQDTYFAGVIKERYEEDTWYTVEEEAEGIELSDTTIENPLLWERLYYLYYAGIEADDKVRFAQSHTYDIQYESLNTQVIFYPANFYLIRQGEDETQILREGTNLISDGKQSRGDGYEISGLSMNLKHESLVEYLRTVTAEESFTDVMALLESVEEVKDSGTLFAECVKRMGYSKEKIEELTDKKWESVLRERDAQIRKRNLQLPENISEEMRKLAEELTKNCTNDYDKVQAIIRYLKEDGGFTYSTVPTEPPEEGTVMDYFLFESREGYCTYYATALTLLCRLVDIPARYVEGVTPDYEEERDGRYPVWGGDSHAWTQVYFTGFGWMDVDATPGREVSSSGWQNLAATYEQRGETGVESSEIDMMETEPDTDEESTIRTFLLQGRGADIGLWLCYAAGGLMVILVAAKGIARITFMRSGRRKQAEILMRRLLHTLKRRGLEIRPDETLRMYQMRLMDEEDDYELYSSTFGWYESVRYGGEVVKEEDIRRLEEICKLERKRTRRIRWQRRLHVSKSRVRNRKH